MATKIFVNLSVENLDRSKAFFTSLGYTFNPQFTDENAACLIINEHIYAMLMLPESFKRFTKKEIANAHTTTEAIFALSVDSREAVDAIAAKVLAAGGKDYREAEDYGWMYNRPMEDLDGHIWEFFWMDESKAGEAAQSVPIQS